MSSNIKEEPPDKLGLRSETSSVDSPLVRDESSNDVNTYTNCTTSVKIQLQRVDSEVKRETVKHESELPNGEVKSEKSDTKTNIKSCKVDETNVQVKLEKIDMTVVVKSEKIDTTVVVKSEKIDTTVEVKCSTGEPEDDETTNKNTFENKNVGSVCEAGDKIENNDEMKIPLVKFDAEDKKGCLKPNDGGGDTKIDSDENNSKLPKASEKDCDRIEVAESKDEKTESVSESKIKEMNETVVDNEIDTVSKKVLISATDKSTEDKIDEKEDKKIVDVDKPDKKADKENVGAGGSTKSKEIPRSSTDENPSGEKSDNVIKQKVDTSHKDLKDDLQCDQDPSEDQSKTEMVTVDTEGSSIEKTEREKGVSVDTEKDNFVTRKSSDALCEDQLKLHESKENKTVDSETPLKHSNKKDKNISEPEKISEKLSDEDKDTSAKKECAKYSDEKILAVDKKSIDDIALDLSTVKKDSKDKVSITRSISGEGDGVSTEVQEENVTKKSPNDDSKTNVGVDGKKRAMSKLPSSEQKTDSKGETETLREEADGGSGSKLVEENECLERAVPNRSGDKAVEKVGSKSTDGSADQELENGNKGDDSAQLDGKADEVKDNKVENDRSETETKLSNHIDQTKLNEASLKSKEEKNSCKPAEDDAETSGVRRSKRRRTAPVTLNMAVLEKKNVRGPSKETKSKNKQEVNTDTPVPENEGSETTLVNGDAEETEKTVVGKKKQEVKGKDKKGSARKRVIDEQDSSVDSPVEPEVKRSRPARSAALRGRGKRRILELENMSSTDSEDIPLSQLNSRSPPKGQRAKKNKKKMVNKTSLKRDKDSKDSTPDPEMLETGKGRKSSRQVKVSDRHSHASIFLN